MPAMLISVYGLQLYFLLRDGILFKGKNCRLYLKFVFQTLPLLTRGALKYIDKRYRPWNPKDVQIYQFQRKKIHHIIS
jgi:hypothetical protein